MTTDDPMAPNGREDPAFSRVAVFHRVWGDQPNPPVITAAVVPA